MAGYAALDSTKGGTHLDQLSDHQLVMDKAAPCSC